MDIVNVVEGGEEVKDFEAPSDANYNVKGSLQSPIIASATISSISAMDIVSVVDGGEEVKDCEATLDATCDIKGPLQPPIVASATTSSIALDWRTPDHDRKTIFEVKMKLLGALEWPLVYYGKATSFTLAGLPSGANTAVHIRAINQGTNGWSSLALYSTLPTPPEAPTALVASNVDSSEVVLEWLPPMHNGGSPITGFRLLMEILRRTITPRAEEVSATESSRTQEPNAVALTFGNSTRFIAEGLAPGVTYRFRVQALNTLGASPYSEPVVVKRPSLPPNVTEPPVVLEKTFKSVSLSWPSPPCNGASIESFTLQLLFLGYGEKCLPTDIGSDSATNLDLQGTSSDDLEEGTVFEGSVDSPGLALYNVYSGPSNEFIVKKLRPFSTYAFRVQARNAAGTSGFSAFSTCMTPAAAPHPPAPPTVEKTDSSSVTLIWEIPELDNGSPVLRYSLEMQKVELNTTSIDTVDSGKKTGKKKLSKQVQLATRVWVVVYDGLELRAQVSDLAPGNEYSFRVKARNALGTSAPSSTMVVFTLPSAPSAPLPPTFGRVTPTSVQIKWASPACDNGFPVTSYKLLLDDGQGGPLQKIYEGEVRSFNASKLVPALSYRAAVQAINACGASEMSKAAVVELPAVLPVELPVAPQIAPPSPATVVDDLPRPSQSKARPVPATLDVVARKKTRPVPATVEVKAKKKERAVPAPARVEKEEPALPETIKSIKEVKEIMRLKARQGWHHRISRALIQTSWHVQYLWPLWAFLVCVVTVAYIFVELPTKG